MSHRPLRDPEKEKFWRDAISRQRRSGLSQAEFCRREELNENSFSSWKSIIAARDDEERQAKILAKRAAREQRRQLQREKQLPAKNEVPAFVPLVLAGADRHSPSTDGALVEIRLPGAAILVYQGADSDTLRSVMLAFRECWY